MSPATRIRPSWRSISTPRCWTSRRPRRRRCRAPTIRAAGPLALDRLYIAIANRLESRGSSPLLALRLEGLDATGHYYLRQAMPRAFGDVSDEERRKYGQVLEQYYRYVDAVIGGIIDGLGPRDLLLVVSPFGLEPLSPAKRLLEHSIGNPALSGSHERAPDGFLLAYGTTVKPGRLPRGAIVDVTPTILYFLGLPVGRDMDGFARADIFTREFTASPAHCVYSHLRTLVHRFRGSWVHRFIGS